MPPPADPGSKGEALKRVLAEAGVAVKGGKCRCIHPDHDDKNPSCYVYDDGHFHCYAGNCKAHGDAADALIYLKHGGDRSQLGKVLQDLGWSDSPNRPPASRPAPAPAPPPDDAPFPSPPPDIQPAVAAPPAKKSDDWKTGLTAENIRSVENAAKIWKRAEPLTDEKWLPEFYKNAKDPIDFIRREGAKVFGFDTSLRVIPAKAVAATRAASLDKLSSPSGEIVVARIRVPGIASRCAVQLIGNLGKKTVGVLRMQGLAGFFVAGNLATASRIYLVEGVGDAVALRTSIARGDDTAILASLGTSAYIQKTDDRIGIGSVGALIQEADGKFARDWIVAPDGDPAGRDWGAVVMAYLRQTRRRCELLASPPGSDPADVVTSQAEPAVFTPPQYWTRGDEIISLPEPPGWDLPWNFYQEDGRKVRVACPLDGLLMIGGRPSGGKTELLAALIMHRLAQTAQTDDGLAWHQKIAAVVSADQSPRTMAGHLSRYERAVATLDRTSIATHDLINAATVALNAYRLADRAPLACVAWDYLNLFHAGTDGSRRDLEIGQIVQIMRTLGQTTQSPQLVAVQVGRIISRADITKSKIEKIDEEHDLVAAFTARRPGMHDLRDGGSEAGGDVILGVQSIAGEARGFNLATDNLRRDAKHLFVVEVVKDRHSHHKNALAVLFRNKNKILVNAEWANPYAQRVPPPDDPLDTQTNQPQRDEDQ